MKLSSEPAFGHNSMTKYEYAKIEILKSLIVPGKNYTGEEISMLLLTTNKIVLRLIETT